MTRTVFQTGITPKDKKRGPTPRKEEEEKRKKMNKGTKKRKEKEDRNKGEKIQQPTLYRDSKNVINKVKNSYKNTRNEFCFTDSVHKICKRFFT